MPLGLGRAGVGIAGVPEALAVGGPGHRAAGGWVLHPVDRARDLLARSHVIDVQGPVLAAVLRQRHSHLGAVRRGVVPVDLGVAGRIGDVGVEDVTARGRIGRGVEQDQPGLLLGRVLVHGEDAGRPRLQARGLGRGGLGQPGELGGDRIAAGQRVQIPAGAHVLGGAPGLHLGIGGVFQAPVGIGDLDALQDVDRVAAREGRRRRQGRRGGRGGGHGERDRAESKPAMHGIP